jgi:hypothetical protein
MAVALATPAHASRAVFRLEFVGNWCAVNARHAVYVSEKCRRGEPNTASMKLTRERYIVSGADCSLIAGRREKITTTGFTFKATVRCQYAEGPFDQKITFKFDADVHQTLFSGTIRTSARPTTTAASDLLPSTSA